MAIETAALLAESEAFFTLSPATVAIVVTVLLSINTTLVIHSLMLRGIGNKLDRLTQAVVAAALGNKNGKNILAKLIGSKAPEDHEE